MSEGQQLITEYPSVDDHEEPDAGIEADAHDTVRFDLLEDDSSSIQRAREQYADIEIVEDGYHLAFEDGDHDHLVVLYRDEDGWQADCWYLDDDGQRIGRCRGWVHHDGPAPICGPSALTSPTNASLTTPSDTAPTSTAPSPTVATDTEGVDD